MYQFIGLFNTDIYLNLEKLLRNKSTGWKGIVLKSNKNWQYDTITRLLHWVIALLSIWPEATTTPSIKILVVKDEPASNCPHLSLIDLLNIV